MADIGEWSGDLGAKWARHAAVMERMLKPFGEAAMDALGDLRGRRALDLGCGGGATTMALAVRAGPDGAALGVDVSPDLIALAEHRRAAATGDAARAGFLCADAGAANFGAPFDALFSQFGAMFFGEPDAAFANLRRAMAPGAPLAIACWRTPKENEWATLALGAAKPLLPEEPPADRFAPGPFAWSIPEETFAPMLERAGWRDAAWTPLDHVIELGAGMEGGAVERAVRFSLAIGPLARRLDGLPEATLARVETAVREALAAKERDGRVAVAGAAWLVTARA